MTNVADKREQGVASSWGVFGEGIVWPPGFTCVSRMEGQLTHGESWVVRDDVPKAIAELEAKKAKLEAGVRQISRAIEGLELELEGVDEKDEDDLLDCNDDDDDEAEEYDEGAERNVHDIEDTQNKLDESEAIKHQLIDALQEVEGKLGALNDSKFKFEWTKKKLPPQLKRMDAPWLNAQRLKDQEDEAARVAAAAAAQALEEKKKKRDGKKKGRRGSAVETNEGEEKLADIPEGPKYCAKLHEAGTVVAADGRRFNFSDGHEDKTAIRTLLVDGEEILRCQWRLILTRGNGDFDPVGILPLVAVCDVTRTHQDFQDTYNAAFIYPHCSNGTVVDAVKRIAGRRKDYWFKDELILENLKSMIVGMAYLENNKVWHGNIKPSNVFIGEDGYKLLLGDFLPKSEQKRWFGDLVKNLANIPQYMSPEFHKALVARKVRNFSWIVKNLDFYKNDVFTLGCTYYYITTRKEPKQFSTSARTIGKGLREMVDDSHNAELIALLSRMMTFNQEDRPRFWDLLPLSEQAQFTSDTVRGVIQGIFGFGPPKQTEDVVMGKRKAADSVETETDGQGCGVM